MMDVDDEDLDDLYRAAYVAAFRLLDDVGEAQDCAQEATARALARWSQVAAHGVPWVARVSTNLAIGILRKRRRCDIGLPAGLHVAVAGSLDAAVADGVDLRVALLGLPSRQRQVLVMRYFGDFSEQD